MKEKQKRHRWTADDDALLGTMSDSDLAARLGVSVAAARQRQHNRDTRPRDNVRKPKYSWTPERDALLGTMSDQKAAKKLGLTFSAARQRRVRLGIPAAGTVPRPWTESEIAALGTDVDDVIAKLLGRPRASVVSKRINLGIDPAPRSKRKSPTGRPHRAGMTMAPNSTQAAYRPA